jgi:hypothetical protein
MNPLNVLDIQLVDEAHQALRLGRVSIDVIFFLKGRERYRFDAGCTNDDGKLMAPYRLFEDVRKDNQAFALMDYNTKIEECDADVIVRAPEIDELQQRLTALTKWFPDRALSMLEVLKVTNNGRIQAAEKRVRLGDEIPTQVKITSTLRSRF